MPSLGNDEMELVYLAGFFDADGSLGIYAHNGRDRRPRKTTRRYGEGLRARSGWAGTTGLHQYYSLRAAVMGLHRGSIARFHERWGGTLHTRRALRTGKIEWYWFATGTRARLALTELLPFLYVKRAQAALAIQAPVGMPGHNLSPKDRAERIEIAERLKQMKKEVA